MKKRNTYDPNLPFISNVKLTHPKKEENPKSPGTAIESRDRLTSAEDNWTKSDGCSCFDQTIGSSVQRWSGCIQHGVVRIQTNDQQVNKLIEGIWRLEIWDSFIQRQSTHYLPYPFLALVMFLVYFPGTSLNPAYPVGT